MLASSAIIEINNKYNEAVLCMQYGRTSCITVGKLGKNSLVYLVNQNCIELGLKEKDNITLLDNDTINLLKAGYSKRPNIINMIDIANNLNKYSKLKAEQ